MLVIHVINDNIFILGWSNPLTKGNIFRQDDVHQKADTMT